MFTQAYNFKTNKITRSFIIYWYEINVQYFAGNPISIIRYKQSVKSFLYLMMLIG